MLLMSFTQYYLEAYRDVTVKSKANSCLWHAPPTAALKVDDGHKTEVILPRYAIFRVYDWQ